MFVPIDKWRVVIGTGDRLHPAALVPRCGIYREIVDSWPKGCGSCSGAEHRLSWRSGRSVTASTKPESEDGSTGDSLRGRSCSWAVAGRTMKLFLPLKGSRRREPPVSERATPPQGTDIIDAGPAAAPRGDADSGGPPKASEPQLVDLPSEPARHRRWRSSGSRRCGPDEKQRHGDCS